MQDNGRLGCEWGYSALGSDQYGSLFDLACGEVNTCRIVGIASDVDPFSKK
jgi:hypothetical protein